jgi:hypothetical protein
MQIGMRNFHDLASAFSPLAFASAALPALPAEPLAEPAAPGTQSLTDLSNEHVASRSSVGCWCKSRCKNEHWMVSKRYTHNAIHETTHHCQLVGCHLEHKLFGQHLHP